VQSLIHQEKPVTFALVIVDKAAPRATWPGEMFFFVHEMPSDAGVTRLNEGAWLLDLDTELLILAGIVQTAHSCGLPIQALFFDQKPNFSTLEAAQKA
jgi:hypothetical protein